MEVETQISQEPHKKKKKGHRYHKYTFRSDEENESPYEVVSEIEELDISLAHSSESISRSNSKHKHKDNNGNIMSLKGTTSNFFIRREDVSSTSRGLRRFHSSIEENNRSSDEFEEKENKESPSLSHKHNLSSSLSSSPKFPSKLTPEESFVVNNSHISPLMESESSPSKSGISLNNASSSSLKKSGEIFSGSVILFVETEDYEELNISKRIKMEFRENSLIREMVSKIFNEYVKLDSCVPEEFTLWHPRTDWLDGEERLGDLRFSSNDSLVLRRKQIDKDPISLSKNSTPSPNNMSARNRAKTLFSKKLKTVYDSPDESPTKVDRKNIISSPIQALHQRRKSITNFSFDKKKSLPSLIPIKDILYQGYLLKKNKNRRWKRRWLVLDNHSIYCFKNFQDTNPPKPISLFCASIKQQENKNKFEIVTPDQTHEFSAEIDEEAIKWVNVLQEVCHNLVYQSIGSVDKLKYIPRFHELQENVTNNPSFVLKDSEEAKKAEINSETKQKLLEIMNRPENRVCADCESPYPEWVSVNLGVFICISCSGAHRSLGTHISKVRSCMLDVLDETQIEFLDKMGNEIANSIWEYHISPEFKKPNNKASLEERNNYIRKKYEQKLFTKENQLIIEPDQDLNVLLYWEGTNINFGYLEVNTSDSIFSLRQLIVENSIPINGSYLFLQNNMPITYLQEKSLRILDIVVSSNKQAVIFLRQ